MFAVVTKIAEVAQALNMTVAAVYLAKSRVMARLKEVADGHYEGKGWWADPHRRNIPDHWHCHARPAGGFFAR